MPPDRLFTSGRQHSHLSLSLDAATNSVDYGSASPYPLHRLARSSFGFTKRLLLPLNEIGIVFRQSYTVLLEHATGSQRVIVESQIEADRGAGRRAGYDRRPGELAAGRNRDREIGRRYDRASRSDGAKHIHMFKGERSVVLNGE